MKKEVQYKTKFQGLPIAIETRKGQYRHWYDPHSREKGKTLMEYPYGYVEGTLGLDGDEVDVFLGPHKDSERVFVITQMKRFEFKTVDEQKVMIGFNNPIEAKTAYLNHFNNARFFGTIQEITLDEFKDKLSSQYGKLIKSQSPLISFNESAKMEQDNMFYLNLDSPKKEVTSMVKSDKHKEALSSLFEVGEKLSKAKASLQEEDMDLKKTEEEDEEESNDAKKSLDVVEDIAKALKSSAVAGLSRRQRLNVAHKAGMAAGYHKKTPVKAEPVVVDHDQLVIGSTVRRPLYEPLAVPVRQVSTPGYIPPKECGDVTYKTPPAEDQEAKPFWRR